MALPTLEASAASGGPTVAGLLWDAAVERPISLVETAVGVGVASVAYPLALGSDSSGLVLERCVGSPARHTFTRALGNFETRERSECSPVGFSWTLVKMSLSVVQRPLGLIFGDSPLSERERSSPPDELEVQGPRRAPQRDEAEI
jgi:hypothetical protein